MTPELFDIIAKIHKSKTYEVICAISERFGLSTKAATNMYQEYIQATKAGAI